MSFKRFLLAAIIGIECVLAGLIGYKIHSVIRQRDVKGANVMRLRKESYIFPKVPPLKHYFEPIPNDEAVNDDSWLPKITTSSINSDGLNSLQNYSVEKRDRTFRIVTLGDSFTYSVFVNTEDSWPSQLEKLLNTQAPCSLYDRYEVINLGVPGYDLLYEKTIFMRKGLKYQPDLVLWMVLENDFNEMYEQMADTKNEIAQKEFPADIYFQKGGYGKVMARVREEFQKTNNDTWWHEYYVSVFDDFFRMYPRKTLFLGLSDFDRYKNTLQQLIADKPYASLYTGLESIYKKEGNQFADYHPNEKAYKEFADAIASYITSHDLVMCR